MTHGEIIKRFKQITGVEISKTTLNRWARWGLIPSQTVVVLGRGVGAHSTFPPDVLAEAIATQAVLGTKIDFRPVTKHELQEARSLALGGDVDQCHDERLKKIARLWLELRERYMAV